MLTLGIDDAGRGPVLGPMILAGCLVDKDAEKEFRKLGVRDSKQLTQKRREFLSKIIKEKSKTFEIVITSPTEIDKKKEEGIKLNELEAIKVAKIINKINDKKEKIKVVVDCPSPNITAWTNYLKTKIDDLSNLKISCEHKADKNNVSVSAASVLAKTTREKEMDKLRKKYGDKIGSGYPSDPLTCTFLKKNSRKLQKEKVVRESWATWKNACSSQKQRKLSEF